MEKIREDLARLFDEMLTQVGGFRKKTYNGVFEKGFRQFCNVPEEIGSLCEETPEEETSEETSEETEGSTYE